MADSLSDFRLFDTLASLNKIGAAMNHIAPGDALSVATTLNLIGDHLQILMDQGLV